MSALQTVVGNARSTAHIAHALMSVNASTPESASAASLEMALESATHFRHVWPYLILALRKNQRLDRNRISRALSAMWSDSPDPWEAESLRGLARVAHACFDVKLAIGALRALRDLQALTAPDLLLAAECHAACGDLQLALVLCESVLARAPRNVHAASLHRSLNQRQQSWRQPWLTPVVAPDGLRLEPLHVDHAQALAWQYRAPEIAAKTLLPTLEEPSMAKDWVEHRLAEANIVPYALLHADHGFVGSIEITVSGTEGFLCIWIGTDWQARGLGRRMIDMACEHAFRCGIEVMLTAAFDSNTASLRTLRGCGFAEVPIRAVSPDHDRTFLCLPTRPLQQEEIVRRLIQFADRAETGLVFPIPASSADGSTASEIQIHPEAIKEDQ